MSKKDFSVALKYVEARPRSQRRKGAEARVSGISVVGSGASATDLSLLQANLISVTNNFTALKDLFDSMFEKDSEGNIHAKLSLWSSGGITAGGVGSGGSGGGGGISYNRLDSWADYSADKAGYVLSALLGKDLDNRVSALANAGYITASYLAPYALRSEIPSLVGYATESFVTSQGYITQSALGGYATQGWVGDNYLSKSGGTISDLIIDRNPSVIQYKKNGASVGYLGIASELKPVLYNAEGNTAYMILHSGNYSSYALPITGGTLTGTTSIPLYIKSSHATEAAVGFGANNAKGYGYIVYKGGGSWAVTKEQWGAEYSILHTGNYSNLLAGGTINGSLTATSFIGGTSTISGDLKGLQNLIFADGYLGRKFSLTNSGGIFYQAPSGSVGWATNWSVKSNDGITSFGDLGGAFGVGNSLNYFYYGGEYNAPSIAIMPSGMIAIGGTTADEKLHVHGNGKFTGALTVNSLTIGGVTLTYDSVNEALCINGNMYALGGITAGGAGISAYTSLESRVARLEQQLNIS